MHMLCKYDFVRFIVDLFVGPFNCLNLKNKNKNKIKIVSVFLSDMFSEVSSVNM